MILLSMILLIRELPVFRSNSFVLFFAYEYFYKLDEALCNNSFPYKCEHSLKNTRCFHVKINKLCIYYISKYINIYCRSPHKGGLRTLAVAERELTMADCQQLDQRLSSANQVSCQNSADYSQLNIVSCQLSTVN